MATKHTRIVLALIHWRRHYVRRRILKELGWRDAWSRAYGSK